MITRKQNDVKLRFRSGLKEIQPLVDFLQVKNVF